MQAATRLPVTTLTATAATCAWRTVQDGALATSVGIRNRAPQTESSIADIRARYAGAHIPVVDRPELGPGVFEVLISPPVGNVHI